MCTERTTNVRNWCVCASASNRVIVVDNTYKDILVPYVDKDEEGEKYFSAECWFFRDIMKE